MEDNAVPAGPPQPPERPQELAITSSTRGTTAVLAIAGELDLAGVEQLRAAADDALDSGAAAIDLDLAGLAFIDSIGLREILRLNRLAAEHGRTLTVVGCSRVVRRMIVLAGLETVLALPAE